MDARNEKPPVGGGLTRQGGCLTLNLRFERDGSLTDCSSPVKHPTTPNLSGILVGVTTRRMTLNPHRGSQPVGARRIVGKRKWHLRGRTLSKSSRQRMAPSVIKPHDPVEASFRLNRADSPSVIGVLEV